MLAQEVEGWCPLLLAGYVAFGESGNDDGPLCFDLLRRSADGDCPVVLFDHDALISLGEANCGVRDLVASYAQPVFSSFRDLLEKTFLAAKMPND